MLSWAYDDVADHDDYLLKPAARDRARRSGALEFPVASLFNANNPMSPSLPARGLLGLIQIYKWMLSPLIGRDCRYQPTCSSYAADAIRAHGAWAGIWMALARVCRCSPWGGHGWDPAPASARANAWWRPWAYGDWKGGYRPPPAPESAKSNP